MGGMPTQGHRDHVVEFIFVDVRFVDTRIGEKLPLHLIGVSDRGPNRFGVALNANRLGNIE